MYRDSEVVAFFPREPATLGHTLVVPRAHVPDIWSVDPALADRLARATLRVAAAVARSMKPDGLNVIQSNGATAGQSVMHLHVHLVPRWDGDAVGRIWPDATDYSEAQKDNAWRRIRDESDRMRAEGAPVAATTGPGRPGSQAPDPEDRRKHLELIQAVVARMSAASATAKGWVLPIATAAYGYALVERTSRVAVLGMLAVALFGVIDANYLRQERSFRRLYDAVAGGGDVRPFSMDPSLAAPAAPAPPASGRNIGRAAWAAVRSWFPERTIWSSWAVAPFYGGLLVAGALIACLFAR